MDGDTVTSVTWEAYAHHLNDKSNDWYWVVGIVSICLAFASMLLGNILLALLVVIAAGIIMMLAYKETLLVPYAVTTRGIRIDNKLYPYSTLESYYIAEEDEEEPMLLVKSERWLLPLLTIPLPPEYLDEVEELLAARLPEEPMEEPALLKLLSAIGL